MDKDLVELAKFIEGELKTEPTLPTKCRIYKVPDPLCSVRKHAYEPQILSIGPLHYENQKLWENAKYKWKYLNEFLRRTPDLQVIDYVKFLKDLEGRVRDCYTINLDHIESYEFVKMMMVDGCFLLQFLNGAQNIELSVDKVKCDILKLENQLPFFLLEELFKLIPYDGQRIPRHCLFEMLANTFLDDNIMPTTKVALNEMKKNPGLHVEHILDWFRRCLVPRSPSRKDYDYVADYPTERNISAIPLTVTALHEAGVRFQQNSDWTITFNEGVLGIPHLYINDGTECISRNLIALEQCREDYPSYLTDFAFFMDSLIDSSEDVKILCHDGIIKNNLGDDMKALHVFDQITKEVSWPIYHDSYTEIRLRLSTYYRTPWHRGVATWYRWMTNLKGNYFNTPWKIIALGVSIVLLILTLIQTINSFCS